MRYMQKRKYCYPSYLKYKHAIAMINEAVDQDPTINKHAATITISTFMDDVVFLIEIYLDPINPNDIRMPENLSYREILTFKALELNVNKINKASDTYSLLRHTSHPNSNTITESSANNRLPNDVVIDILKNDKTI